MSLLKIELDLPEFEKEININITIKKDGEVVYTATSSPSSDGDIIEEKIESPKSSKKSVTKKNSSNGNFMNLDL
jgi:hypothetical protein